MERIIDLAAWRDVPGYEGLYQVSDNGQVRSLDRRVYNAHNGWIKIKGKTLKAFTDRDGYQKVVLCREGVTCYCGVHRLVALAFIPNPENKPCIDHINTVTNDNRVDNLRWATHKDNANNPLTILKQSGRKHSMETRLKMSLNNHQPSAVAVKCLDTNLVFKSMADAARSIGGTSTGLMFALNEKRKYKGLSFVRLNYDTQE